MFGLISALSKLSVSPSLHTLRHIHTNNVLLFKSSPILFAEPLRKKKKMDPAIIRAREERKRKKIEKQIRKLEKHARQLKPIDECEVPVVLLDDKSKRERPVVALSAEEEEYRALLEKEWAKGTAKQWLNDYKNLDRIIASQQKALDKLREVSEELYQEAIQVDVNLVPYKGKGTVFSPPIEDYDSPDGEYKDVTKNWHEF